MAADCKASKMALLLWTKSLQDQREMHHSKMKSREGRCGRHYLEDKATACKYEARHGEAIFWRGNFIPWFLTEENDQEISEYMV
ncbi:unnamed protein product [Urochloa humidicola]